MRIVFFGGRAFEMSSATARPWRMHSPRRPRWLKETYSAPEKPFAGAVDGRPAGTGNSGEPNGRKDQSRP